MTLPDPWTALRQHTAARLALGRAGNSLPTQPWLAFGVAHAMARDAVHEALDSAALVAQLSGHGFEQIASVESAATDRATYLRRPDLGRRLSQRSASLLGALAALPGVVVVVGDGLSARAVQQHALPLLLELRPRLQAQGQTVGQVVVVQQARVALGDEVSVLLRASPLLVLIGERPGLSSPDSLGAYLTWAPAVGCADAQRNCVSNIRPLGLPLPDAAHRIAWLLAAARRLGASGVALKDNSPAWQALPGQPGQPALPGLPGLPGQLAP